MATGSKLIITEVGYRNKDTYNPSGRQSRQQRKAKKLAVKMLRARLKEQLNSEIN